MHGSSVCWLQTHPTFGVYHDGSPEQVKPERKDMEAWLVAVVDGL